MKIEKLFSCLKGNRILEFIKENSLVFHNKPGEELPAPESEKTDAEREKIKEEAIEKRKAYSEDLSKKLAGDLPEEEAQKTFDELIKNLQDLPEGKIQKGVDNLVNFAEKTNPEDNFDKILKKIEKTEISPYVLSTSSIEKIFNFYNEQDDEDKLNILTETMLRTSQSTSKLIEATKNYSEFIKKLFEKIKDKVVFKEINSEALKILIEKIGLDQIFGKMSETQKSEILNSKSFDLNLKTQIFNKIINEKTGKLSDLSPILLEAMVLFAANEKPDYVKSTLKPNLDEKTIGNLTLKAAKAILEKTEDDKEFHNKILENLNAEIRASLEKGSGEEAAAPEAEPAPAETAGETFSNDISVEDMIKAAGLELTPKGRKIKWAFKIGTTSEEVESERSFMKTKKFLSELTRKNPDGTLVYNTGEKVKWLCYSWLTDVIERDGSNRTNKHGVVEFEKSNAQLKAEIESLEAKLADFAKTEAERMKLAPKGTLVVAASTGTPAAEDTPAATGGNSAEGAPEGAPAPSGGTADSAAETAPSGAPAPTEGAAPAPTPGGTAARDAETETDHTEGRAEEETPPETIYEGAELTQKLQELEEKGLKMTTASPTRLGKPELEALNQDADLIKSTFNELGNAQEIINNLKGIGNRLKSLFHTFKLQNSIGAEEIAQIEFTIEGAKTPLIWSNKEANNNGFGAYADLVRNILTIKEEQLGTDSEGYKEFFTQSQIAQKEAQTAESKEKTLKEKNKEYLEAYKKLTDKRFKMDPRIGSLNEEKMAAFFDYFENHTKVEAVMRIYPFGLPKRQIGKVASAIITENDNRIVHFYDIFKFMGGFPKVKEKGVIPENLLGDGDKFYSKFNDLMQEEKLSESDQKLLDAMFEDILTPCLNLLEAMEGLRYPDAGLPEHAKDFNDNLDVKNYHLKFTKETITNPELIKPLEKLFNYSENTAGGYQKFLGLAGGAQKITMANMDGSTFDVDEGILKRHFDPETALVSFLEKPEIYTLDEKGQKTLNEQAILAKVNELIKLGYIAKMVQAVPKTEKADMEKIRTDAANYEVKDLKNFTDEQMLAFQVGFIINETAKTDKAVKENIKAIIENSPLEIRKILEEGRKAGIPNEQLLKIRSTMLGIVGLHWHNGKFVGIGIGTGIRIDDNRTLLIEATYNATGEGPALMPGIGLGVRVLDNGSTTVNLGTIFFVAGLGVGTSVSHEADSGVEVGAGTGVGVSFTNLMNGGASVGITLSWDKMAIKQAQAENTDTEAKKAGLTVEFINKWTASVEGEKLKMLKESGHWEEIKEVVDEYPRHLTDENLVLMYDNYIEKIKASASDTTELPFPIPAPVGIGFGLVGVLGGLAAAGPVGAVIGGIIAGMQFRLGTVSVFVPQARQEMESLEYVLDEITTRQSLEFINNLKSGEPQIAFIENTPNIYLRPGSGLGLGIRQESHEIDLSGLVTGIDKHNEALAKAEVSLKKTGNKNIHELFVGNLLTKKGIAAKDLELHADPNANVKIITDGGKIFLVGDISDMIISRERFKFSHLKDKGRSSIRDAITIRRAASQSGEKKVDRQWLQDNEDSYVEIRMGEKNFSHELREPKGARQKNLTEIPGFLAFMEKNIVTLSDAEKRTRKGIEEYWYKFSPDLETTTINKEEAEAMEGNVKDMFNALGTRTESEYQAEKMRENLDASLKGLFKDKAFQKELSPIADQAKIDQVETLLKEYSEKPEFETLKNLSDKETTYAVSFLMTEWFTTAYIQTDKEKEGKELSEKELIKKNHELKKRIELVRDYTKKKYEAEFAKVIPKMSPALETQNAETLATKFMEGIYDELLKELDRKTTPPAIFNFKDLGVTEIPSGSEFLSGTRIIKDKDKVRAISHVISYEKVKKEEGLVHEYGFLKEPGKEKGYGKEYKLNGTGVERDLARILLEIARPIPEGNADLLKTPMAVELLGLGAYRLIAGETKEEATKNYKTLIEFAKGTSIYDEKNLDHKAAVDRLREVIVQIRKDQHKEPNKDGTPNVSEFKTVTGHIIKIDMVSGTTFVSGAFTKCTNPSFYIPPVQGKVTVETPKSGVTGTRNDIQQITDAETTIASVTFSLAMGATGSKVEKQKVEEEGKEPAPAADKGGSVSTEAPGVSGDGTRSGQTSAAPPATLGSNPKIVPKLKD